MFTKEFLQSRLKVLLQDGIKGEFPTPIRLVMPLSKTSAKTKTWDITAMVTEISQEDSSRLSVENMEYKVVDIFDNDIAQLKIDNPSAYIITKNFQQKVQVEIEGKVFKIREEKPKEGFEKMVRFICERSTMTS